MEFPLNNINYFQQPTKQQNMPGNFFRAFPDANSFGFPGNNFQFPGFQTPGNFYPVNPESFRG